MMMRVCVWLEVDDGDDVEDDQGAQEVSMDPHSVTLKTSKGLVILCLW